jgi:chromosome segregation ATPase
MHDLQEECYDSEETLQGEINVANARVEAIQEELDEKIPLRNRRDSQLAERQEFRTHIQEEIIELGRKMHEREDLWEQTQQDHSKATYVITTAKDALQGSLVAFAQKSSITGVFAQVTQHFTSSAKKVEFKQMKSFNNLFHILAQITASTPVQADQSKVG